MNKSAKLDPELIADGEQRMLTGIQLFEYACDVTLAGIRHQNPDATPEECEQILRKRLEWNRSREQSERAERRS